MSSAGDIIIVMNLLKYELLKIGHNRLTIGLFFIFLAINLPLFLMQSDIKRYQYLIDSMEDYERLEAQYRAMPFEEAYEELTRQDTLLDQIELLKLAQRDPDSPDTAVLESLLKENPNLLEIYGKMQEENTFPSEHERIAIGLLSDQAVYIHGYQDYIAGMQAQADKMNRFSIFNQPDTFSFRNIAKTPTDFEQNKGLSLSFGLSAGIVIFSEFFPTDAFVLFLLLLFSVRLFWNEKEKGLLILVKSSKNGRSNTVFAKIAALFLSGAVLALLFYGMNMLAAGVLFGFGDTSRCIQSMPEFSGSNIIITVRQYLCLFLLGKIFLVWVFSLLFSAAFSFFRNHVTALLTVTGLIGGSYMAYRYIPYFSPFNPLKFLNPIAALHLMNVLAEYHNINLFGFPCSRVPALLLTMAALLVLSAAAVVFLHTTRLAPAGRTRTTGRLSKLVQAVFARFHGVCLLRHEFCKLAFSRKILLLPIIAILLIFNSIMEREPVFDTDEAVYLDYLTELEGELTEQKETFIREEQERFENLPAEAERIAEQFAEGEITKNRYDYEMFRLNAFRERKAGFAQILEQYDYIKSLRDMGVKAGFVSEISSDYLFRRPDRDTALGLLLLLFTVLTASTAFCQEYKQEMIHIMNPSKNGKGRLYFSKIAVSFVFVLSSMAVYVPQYINSRRFYPLGDLSLPLKNIRQFSDFPFEISIRGYLIFTHFVQTLGLLAALFLTVFLSVKLKKQVTVSITALACSTISPILFSCGIRFAKYLPFASAFLFHQSAGQRTGCIIGMASLLITSVLGIVFLRFSYLEFCNRRRTKNAS